MPSSKPSTPISDVLRLHPKRLIRASLSQTLFSVRSERQLMEQMQYNLLFSWFVGLGIDDPVKLCLRNGDVATSPTSTPLRGRRAARMPCRGGRLLGAQFVPLAGKLVQEWHYQARADRSCLLRRRQRGLHPVRRRLRSGSDDVTAPDDNPPFQRYLYFPSRS